VDEAKEELQSFLQKARRCGHRCLLVVHGRGLHSLGKAPVLKQKLVQWLTRGFLRKEIVAFCSARPHDGGVGATYVLLTQGA